VRRPGIVVFAVLHSRRPCLTTTTSHLLEHSILFAGLPPISCAQTSLLQSSSISSRSLGPKKPPSFDSYSAPYTTTSQPPSSNTMFVSTISALMFPPKLISHSAIHRRSQPRPRPRHLPSPTLPPTTEVRVPRRDNHVLRIRARDTVTHRPSPVLRSSTEGLQPHVSTTTTL
jgi:hypothetical protein